VDHQAGYEAHVAAEAVELCHDDRPFELLGRLDGGVELGAAFQGISALAALNLDVIGSDGEVLGRAEPGNGLALGLEAKAAAALPISTTSR